MIMYLALYVFSCAALIVVLVIRAVSIHLTRSPRRQRRAYVRAIGERLDRSA